MTTIRPSQETLQLLRSLNLEPESPTAQALLAETATSGSSSSLLRGSGFGLFGQNERASLGGFTQPGASNNFGLSDPFAGFLGTGLGGSSLAQMPGSLGTGGGFAETAMRGMQSNGWLGFAQGLVAHNNMSLLNSGILGQGLLTQSEMMGMIQNGSFDIQDPSQVMQLMSMTRPDVPPNPFASTSNAILGMMGIPPMDSFGTMGGSGGLSLPGMSGLEGLGLGTTGAGGLETQSFGDFGAKTTDVNGNPLFGSVTNAEDAATYQAYQDAQASVEELTKEVQTVQAAVTESKTDEDINALEKLELEEKLKEKQDALEKS